VPDVAARVVRLIRQSLDAPAPPADLPADLAGVPGLADLLATVADIRAFIAAMAEGDLSQDLRRRGSTAGSLKMLQAHLNHLIWQTRRVAEGDYGQHIDFMGEFAQAFNSMILRLEESVRALRESEERYHQLAITDSLTGLCNRRQFFALAEAEASRARRHGTIFSVIMMDIDHFKEVNDTFGHAVGDKVLTAFAGILRSRLRSEDILARYGGEEFVALLPESDEAMALALAWRLRAAVAEAPIQLPGHPPVAITCSFGVRSWRPGPGEESDEAAVEHVLIEADTALYAAKAGGRDRVFACCSASGTDQEP
jgi:diguanylate cyclase (GGDEF)-like protein